MTCFGSAAAFVIAAQAADARRTWSSRRRDDAQHRAAASGDARDAADHRPAGGEQVVWAEPVAGYMHRGYEKLTEVRTFPQVTTLINRIDWLGSFANEVPFILAAEKLMDIEAPPRAQWIRTILFELSRISNVGLFLGDLGVQLGAITPVFLAFRDRELRTHRERDGGGSPNVDRSVGSRTTCDGWIDGPRGDAQVRTSATRWTICCSATRSSEPQPRHRRDTGRHLQEVRIVGPELRARASTGTCVGPGHPMDGTRSTQGLDASRGDSFADVVRMRDAEATK